MDPTKFMTAFARSVSFGDEATLQQVLLRHVKEGSRTDSVIVFVATAVLIDETARKLYARGDRYGAAVYGARLDRARSSLIVRPLGARVPALTTLLVYESKRDAATAPRNHEFLVWASHRRMPVTLPFKESA